MKFLKSQKNKIFALTPFFASILILTAIFVLPVLVSAQEPASIVPTTCGGKNQPECGFEHLMLLAKNIMNFLITVSIPLAAIAFAYAGYLMLTAAGSESQISHAREIFTKVLIGFVFVLGAWLIVWTITTTLLCDRATSSSCSFYNLLGS